MSHAGPERFALHFPCEVHDKETHPSRWAAKRAGRCLHNPGLREYPCERYPGHWHVGHIPPAVRRGEYTMDEWLALPWWRRRQLWRAEGAGDDEPAPVEHCEASHLLAA